MRRHVRVPLLLGIVAAIAMGSPGPAGSATLNVDLNGDGVAESKVELVFLSGYPLKVRNMVTNNNPMETTGFSFAWPTAGPGGFSGAVGRSVTGPVGVIWEWQTTRRVYPLACDNSASAAADRKCVGFTALSSTTARGPFAGAPGSSLSPSGSTPTTESITTSLLTFFSPPTKLFDITSEVTQLTTGHFQFQTQLVNFTGGDLTVDFAPGPLGCGTCTDLRNDPKNCGACGNICAPEECCVLSPVTGGASCEPSEGECSGCGNGIREPGEECDGGDLGERTCGSFEFCGGTLSCTSECTLDSSLCRSECGCSSNTQCDDGVFCNGAENCDPVTGACLSGTPPSCNDGKSCTLDTCDAGLDACVSSGSETLLGTDGSGGNLYRIDPTTAAATLIGNMGHPAPSLAADPATGVLYMGAGGGAPDLYSIDPTTGAATLVGNTGLGVAAVPGMDFDAGGTLYATVNVIDDGGSGGDSLATIDKTTGAATVIGAFGGGIGTIEGPGGIEGIVFDQFGRLYGASGSQTATTGVPSLYTIDKATGAARLVAPIVDGSGQAPAGGVVSLEIDQTGTMYGGTGRSTGNLVRIDPATGLFTLIGPSVPGKSLAGLAFLNCGEVCCLPSPSAQYPAQAFAVRPAQDVACEEGFTACACEFLPGNGRPSTPVPARSLRVRPGQSDGSGTADCQISTFAATEVTTEVTVCGNGVPEGPDQCSDGRHGVKGTVNVFVPDSNTAVDFSPGGQPFVSLSGVEVRDASGDGVVEPGESAKIFVPLVNAGPGTVTEVNAVLSSPEADLDGDLIPDGVYITQPASTYMDLTGVVPQGSDPAVCGQGVPLTPRIFRNLVPFNVEIPSTHPADAARKFNLAIMGRTAGPGGAPFDQTLSFTVGVSGACVPGNAAGDFDTLDGFKKPLEALAPEGNAVTYPKKRFKQGHDLHLELRLACGGVPVMGSATPPEIVALSRNGVSIDLTTVDLSGRKSEGDALMFRPHPKDEHGKKKVKKTKWAYDLRTKDLGVGTFIITVKMPNGQRYSAGFELRDQREEMED